MKYLFLILSLLSLRAHAVNVPAAFPVRGPANATVSIVMYGDFQCPFCKRSTEILKQVTKDLPKEVKVVFRHFPLEKIHPFAMAAARAGVCAHDQGRFWEVHDAFYSMDGSDIDDAKIAEVATRAGLDLTKFNDCRTNPNSEARVRQDMQDGELIGTTGTPTFVFVGPNGVKRLPGAYPAEDMKKAIKDVQ